MNEQIQNLTEQAFDEAVSDGLTVIDFWASWCAPCRAMAPQFQRAADLRPNYRFAKVDVDAEPGLAQRFGISSIPTLMVLVAGKPVAAQAGILGADALVEALDRLAAAPVADAAVREAA